jgi:proteasome lid subunit RPN8/RPN11
VKISREAEINSSYVCRKISKEEWAGALIYEFSGSWETKDLVINVLDVYPIKHAHGFSFDSDFDFDYNYAIDRGYDIECIRLGLIHSHCGLPTFFSNPDMEELRENAKFHPFYLSLITNNAGEWTGKIAVHKEEEIVETGKIIYKDVNGNKIVKPVSTNYSKPSAIVFDCDIRTETVSVNSLLEERVKLISKERNVVETSYYSFVTENEKDYIQRFFTDGMYNDIASLIKNEDYHPSFFGPVMFQEIMNAHGKVSNYLLTQYIKYAMSLFNDNSPFSKQLKKDYEQFLKSISSKI